MVLWVLCKVLAHTGYCVWTRMRLEKKMLLFLPHMVFMFCMIASSYTMKLKQFLLSAKSFDSWSLYIKPLVLFLKTFRDERLMDGCKIDRRSYFWKKNLKCVQFYQCWIAVLYFLLLNNNNNCVDLKKNCWVPALFLMSLMSLHIVTNTKVC